MEWASLPVLTATKGAHRQVVRGQSYYAGDGLNKSLVKPERVEDVLRAVRTGRAPELKSGGKAAGGAVVVGTGAAVVSHDDGSGWLIGLGVALVFVGIIGFVIWRKRTSIGAKLRDLKERL